MARDYGSYDSDSAATTTNDDDNSDDDGDSVRDMTLKMTPYSEIEGTLTSVFGNDAYFGQSLGIVWEDLKLVDGCLYHDPEKDNYKVFSWKSVIGMMPGEGDFDATDANQFLMKTYGSTEKRYELVEAVHPDKDDPKPIGEGIMWYSGSNGPKAASKVLAQLLTERGRDMFIDYDEWYSSLSTEEKRRADLDKDHEDHLAHTSGWLSDVDSTNCIRSDLEGRTFSFFEIKKDSDSTDRQFNQPIVEDTVTGEKVVIGNSVTDDSTQGTLDGESGSAAATDGGEPSEADRRAELAELEYSELQSRGSKIDGATGAGSTDEIIDSILEAENGAAEESVPEAINDFVTSVKQFEDFNRDRATDLLNDFITDDGLPLTQDAVENFGGKDAVLTEAGF